jgi:hypothetical protein
MILLYKTLEALASIFSHTGFWLVVWITVLVGFSILLLRLTHASKKPRPWVVRQGECPFCGAELFGTTREYQRLYLLETVSPETKYLCMSCDKEKVLGLLSILGEGR